jgi:hypothetical protein
MRKLTNLDLERAQVPKTYWDVKFKGIPDSAPYRKYIGKYIDEMDSFVRDGVGLYLWSPTNGTGKTAIATLALGRALRHGFSGLYIRAQALKDSSIGGDAFDQGTSISQRARDVDVLVLDDFGKEYKTATGFAENLVEDFMRERIQHGRTTILTSNLNYKAIESEYSKDLYEVMKEKVLFVQVVGPEKGGKNWRDEKADELKKRFL